MSQLDRFASVLAGLSLVVCGWGVTGKRAYYSSKYLQWIDWGPYHSYIGPLIAVFGVALVISARHRVLDRDEAIRLLQSFVDISGRQKEWNRFLSTKTNDPLITDVQAQCRMIAEKYPPDAPGRYTGEIGREMLRHLIERLKGTD